MSIQCRGWNSQLYVRQISRELPFLQPYLSFWDEWMFSSCLLQTTRRRQENSLWFNIWASDSWCNISDPFTFSSNTMCWKLGFSGLDHKGVHSHCLLGLLRELRNLLVEELSGLPGGKTYHQGIQVFTWGMPSTGRYKHRREESHLPNPGCAKLGKPGMGEGWRQCAKIFLVLCQACQHSFQPVGKPHWDKTVYQ